MRFYLACRRASHERGVGVVIASTSPVSAGPLHGGRPTLTTKKTSNHPPLRSNRTLTERRIISQLKEVVPSAYGSIVREWKVSPGTSRTRREEQANHNPVCREGVRR